MEPLVVEATGDMSIQGENSASSNGSLMIECKQVAFLSTHECRKPRTEATLTKPPIAMNAVA